MRNIAKTENLTKVCPSTKHAQNVQRFAQNDKRGDEQHCWASKTTRNWLTLLWKVIENGHCVKFWTPDLSDRRRQPTDVLFFFLLWNRCLVPPVVCSLRFSWCQVLEQVFCGLLVCWCWVNGMLWQFCDCHMNAASQWQCGPLEQGGRLSWTGCQPWLHQSTMVTSRIFACAGTKMQWPGERQHQQSMNENNKLTKRSQLTKSCTANNTRCSLFQTNWVWITHFCTQEARQWHPCTRTFSDFNKHINPKCNACRRDIHKVESNIEPKCTGVTTAPVQQHQQDNTSGWQRNSDWQNTSWRKALRHPNLCTSRPTRVQRNQMSTRASQQQLSTCARCKMHTTKMRSTEMQQFDCWQGQQWGCLWWWCWVKLGPLVGSKEHVLLQNQARQPHISLRFSLIDLTSRGMLLAGEPESLTSNLLPTLHDGTFLNGPQCNCCIGIGLGLLWILIVLLSLMDPWPWPSHPWLGWWQHVDELLWLICQLFLVIQFWWSSKLFSSPHGLKHLDFCHFKATSAKPFFPWQLVLFFCALLLECPAVQEMQSQSCQILIQCWKRAGM